MVPFHEIFREKKREYKMQSVLSYSTILQNFNSKFSDTQILGHSDSTSSILWYDEVLQTEHADVVFFFRQFNAFARKNSRNRIRLVTVHGRVHTNDQMQYDRFT